MLSILYATKFVWENLVIVFRCIWDIREQMVPSRIVRILIRFVMLPIDLTAFIIYFGYLIITTFFHIVVFLLDGYSSEEIKDTLEEIVNEVNIELRTKFGLN